LERERERERESRCFGQNVSVQKEEIGVASRGGRR
jgi:hypothetical protein